MKTTLFAFCAGSFLAGLLPIGVFAADSPALKSGLCINFGMGTFAKPGEQGELPASRFAPASVNVKSWVRATKAAGMTFAVPFVKAGGFCLWPTADGDYDIAHSPFKGDILGDFIAACNAEGILPGAYYFVADAHNEGAGRDGSPVPNLYFNFIKKQIAELHTKYPGLRVQIFNGSDRFSAEQWADLVQLVQRVNPQCVIMDGKHEGVTQLGGGTVLKSYRWQPNAELVPAAELFRRYDQTQAAKKSFLLTVGADRSGNIPDNQIAVLSRLKEMIANPPPAQTTTAPAAKPDAAERLKKVKALFDQGLINKEEYDKKVKEITDLL
jgi:alpha-L-fucosidase